MPNLLRNLPYDAYTELPGIRASALMHMDRSPLHYRYASRSPGQKKACFTLGSGAHTCILEPRHFSERYAVKKFDGRTREGRAEKAAIDAAGQEIITADQFEQCMGMQRAVSRRPDVMSLIEGSDIEVSLTWTDAVYGLPCKCRLDALSQAIADLKTTQNAHPLKFMWDSGKYDYQAKMAYYQDGVEAMTGKVLPVFLIAVESDAPHDVVLFQIPDEVLDVGRHKYRRLLERVARCEAEGVWPGVSPGLVQLELPDKFRAAEEPQVVMTEAGGA